MFVGQPAVGGRIASLAAPTYVGRKKIISGGKKKINVCPETEAQNVKRHPGCPSKDCGAARWFPAAASHCGTFLSTQTRKNEEEEEAPEFTSSLAQMRRIYTC